MKWSRLISFSVAVLGIGLSLSFILFTCEKGLFYGGVSEFANLLSAGGLVLLDLISVAFVVLSYFLHRGRNWARIALIGVCVCVCVVVSIGGLFGLLLASESFLDAASSVGLVVAGMMVPIFVILVLRQPDVIKEFNGRSKT
jgi:uncharacterized sodium:solute symporter family permease YidK